MNLGGELYYMWIEWTEVQLNRTLGGSSGVWISSQLLCWLRRLAVPGNLRIRTAGPEARAERWKHANREFPARTNERGLGAGFPTLGTYSLHVGKRIRFLQ